MRPVHAGGRDVNEVMADEPGLDEQYPPFREARALLKSQGILPGPEGYTPQQLGSEFTRRGWRWSFDVEHAEATKAFTPTGTETHSIFVVGSNPVATLSIVLADAIRFDQERGLRPTPPFPADIVVRGPEGGIVALVEVKNRPFAPLDATAYRRNLIVHGLTESRYRFFVLASQDASFLWDGSTEPLPDSPPTAQFSMLPVVAYYLPWVGPETRLQGAQLELAVATWLSDVASDNALRPSEPERSLAGTGFLEAIKGGSVIMDDWV